MPSRDLLNSEVDQDNYVLDDLAWMARWAGDGVVARIGSVRVPEVLALRDDAVRIDANMDLLQYEH